MDYPTKTLSNLSTRSMWLVTFATLVAIATLITVSKYLNIGLDLTDESFYLNWISNPWLYQYGVTQFGFIYHPVYQWLNHDYVALRLFNLLMTYSLSSLLFFLFLSLKFKRSGLFNLLASLGFSLASITVLTIHGEWLPTPSYNTLDFQGCLITALGSLLAVSFNSRFKVCSAMLIALGGWLVFMAKPSSALLLSIVVLIFLLSDYKNTWRVVFYAVIIVFLFMCLSAVIIDGSLFQFIKRYQGGLLMIQTQGTGHSLSKLFRLDLFDLSYIFIRDAAVLFSFMLIAQFLITRRLRWVSQIVWVCLFLLLLFCLLFSINPYIAYKKVESFYTLIVIVVPIVGLTYGFLNRKSYRQDFRVTIFFLVLPYVYVAGTGNNYWLVATGAFVFWVIAALNGFITELDKRSEIALPLVAVVSLSVYVVFKSMAVPYRQAEPIIKQHASATNPHTGKLIKLSVNTATYLNSLMTLVKETGFKINTPVIDFSGQHPGTLYYMRANPIGQAWNIGGYPGSHQRASMALRQVDCETIASSWLFIQKDGVRRLSLSLLAESGITPSIINYQNMGSIKSRTMYDSGAINAKHPDGIYDQLLYKPINIKNALNNCVEYRKAHPNKLLKTLNE